MSRQQRVNPIRRTIKNIVSFIGIMYVVKKSYEISAMTVLSDEVITNAINTNENLGGGYYFNDRIDNFDDNLRFVQENIQSPNSHLQGGVMLNDYGGSTGYLEYKQPMTFLNHSDPKQYVSQYFRENNLTNYKELPSKGVADSVEVRVEGDDRKYLAKAYGGLYHLANTMAINDLLSDFDNFVKSPNANVVIFKLGEHLDSQSSAFSIGIVQPYQEGYVSLSRAVKNGYVSPQEAEAFIEKISQRTNLIGISDITARNIMLKGDASNFHLEGSGLFNPPFSIFDVGNCVMPGFKNVSLENMSSLRKFINSDKFEALSRLKSDIISLDSSQTVEDYSQVFKIIEDSKNHEISDAQLQEKYYFDPSTQTRDPDSLMLKGSGKGDIFATANLKWGGFVAMKELSHLCSFHYSYKGVENIVNSVENLVRGFNVSKSSPPVEIKANSLEEKSASKLQGSGEMNLNCDREL